MHLDSECSLCTASAAGHCWCSVFWMDCSRVPLQLHLLKFATIHILYCNVIVAKWSELQLKIEELGDVWYCKFKLGFLLIDPFVHFWWRGVQFRELRYQYNLPLHCFPWCVSCSWHSHVASWKKLQPSNSCAPWQEWWREPRTVWKYPYFSSLYPNSVHNLNKFPENLK